MITYYPFIRAACAASSALHLRAAIEAFQSGQTDSLILYSVLAIAMAAVAILPLGEKQ